MYFDATLARKRVRLTIAPGPANARQPDILLAKLP